MAVLPFNNRPFGVYIPGRGRIRFNPTGSYIYPGGVRTNPLGKNLLRYGKNYAARMFVGLSVKHVPTWTVDEVIDYTRAWLKKHEWKEDSSFIAQKGVYSEDRIKGRKFDVYTEDSVQVVVFKMDTGPEEKFRPLMKKFAQALVRKFRQDSVFLEYQEDGITKGLWSVTA